MTYSTPTCTLCHSGETAKKNFAEKAALAVSLITLATMALEISFGLLSGSMALLADGIHMGTHALALFITVGAYYLTRKLRGNTDFSFGTGKIGVLGGYTNALLLGATALFMIYETVERLLNPGLIDFDSAITVAVIGLIVNLASALILGAAQGPHHHAHGAHPHNDGHDHDHGSHKDSNLQGALAHVVTDAATSILAILALVLGKFAGLAFLDPLAGLLGAALILKWAYHLLGDSGAVLLDFGNYRDEIARISALLVSGGYRIVDLHLWRFSENERALMLTVADAKGRGTGSVRRLLSDIKGIDHMTIEVVTK